MRKALAIKDSMPILTYHAVKVQRVRSSNHELGSRILKSYCRANESSLSLRNPLRNWIIWLTFHGHYSWKSTMTLFGNNPTFCCWPENPAIIFPVARNSNFFLSLNGKILNEVCITFTPNVNLSTSLNKV